jgi:hypothetical protein
MQPTVNTASDFGVIRNVQLGEAFDVGEEEATVAVRIETEDCGRVLSGGDSGF